MKQPNNNKSQPIYKAVPGYDNLGNLRNIKFFYSNFEICLSS